MSSIAGENHPAMAEPLQAPTLEGVDADPFQLERPVVAQHRPDPGNDLLGLALFVRVGVPAQLKSSRQTLSACRCSSADCLDERGIEPEPALGREVGLHHHIGDEKPVMEGLPSGLQPSR